MENLHRVIEIFLVLSVTLVCISAQSIPVNEFRCSSIGFFPHETNPQQFYECVKSPSNPNNIISYTYTCPTNFCFDDSHMSKCTEASCSNRGNNTEFTCLKDKLQQDAQINCQEETLTVLRRQLERMVEVTAHRGTPFENLRLSLRDMNVAMRDNYARMIENVGKNVFPLIVATDSEPDMFGVGGVWKVYFKDGSMRRINPVSPAFEIHKSLSHSVLAVFSILAPYFQNPNSINWMPALQAFQRTMHNVRYLLNAGETGLSASDTQLATTMLQLVDTYIQTTLATVRVDVVEYHNFAKGLAPYIDQSMQLAGKAHATASVPALQQLRAEMGAEWERAFVIIPTVWPVSLYNIRLQALEKVMSFEQIKSQVLIVEGARSEAEAKTTLGRILADRALAQLVFGNSDEESMRDHVFSLSTRRDLLSTIASQELNKVCRDLEQQTEQPRCPFSGRDETMGIQSFGQSQPLLATMLRG